MKGNFLLLFFLFLINYLQGLVEFFKNSDRLSLLNIDQLQGIRPNQDFSGSKSFRIFCYYIVFTYI